MEIQINIIESFWLLLLLFFFNINTSIFSFAFQT